MVEAAIVNGFIQNQEIGSGEFQYSVLLGEVSNPFNKRFQKKVIVNANHSEDVKPALLDAGYSNYVMVTVNGFQVYFI